MGKFSIRNFLLGQFDTEPQHSLDFATKESFLAWRDTQRKELARITGWDKIPSFGAPIASHPTEEDCGSYIRKKVILQTHEDIFMPIYVLEPRLNSMKLPIIAIPGHGSNGKQGVCGVDDTGLANYKCDFAHQMACAGHVVFCPDLAGFGERREEREQDDVSKSSCNNINFAAIALGMSLQAIFLNDLTALVDYVHTYNGVDVSKLVCMGFSGGAWQTLWLAAMDDRIKTALVTGYFHGFRNQLFKSNFCGCNFVPGFWEKWRITDLAAMIAPRNLYIETGDKDPLPGPMGLSNVVPYVEQLKGLYDRLGEGFIYHHIFNGGHEYNGFALEYLKMLDER